MDGSRMRHHRLEPMGLAQFFWRVNYSRMEPKCRGYWVILKQRAARNVPCGSFKSTEQLFAAVPLCRRASINSTGCPVGQTGWAIRSEHRESARKRFEFTRLFAS